MSCNYSVIYLFIVQKKNKEKKNKIKFISISVSHNSNRLSKIFITITKEILAERLTRLFRNNI